VDGMTHARIAAFLLTNVRSIEKELERLDARPDTAGKSKNLIQRRAQQFGVLSLAGLFAQYLFVIGR